MWILNLEFCILKFLIFYQKSFWNIRSRLNTSRFWVFGPVFRYVLSKLKLFAQIYLNTDSKTQNVEKLSLDLILCNNFWQNIKSFNKENSKLIIHSKPDRNQSNLTVWNVSSSFWVLELNKECDKKEMKKKYFDYKKMFQIQLALFL